MKLPTSVCHIDAAYFQDHIESTVFYAHDSLSREISVFLGGFYKRFENGGLRPNFGNRA